MKVFKLKLRHSDYSSNVYLVLGSFNGPETVNTIIDAGSAGAAESIVSEVESINTGIGKKAVEQVILTHTHYDHIGGLSLLKKHFSPKVLAYEFIPGVTETIYNYNRIRIGDREFVVLHTPGHSPDSICLYCEEEKTIFSGDVPLNVKTSGGIYSKAFVKALERISSLEIETIYTGHDEPVKKGASSLIRNTLEVVRKSSIV